MALVFCTRCGHRLSTTAPKCPSSGAPPYAARLSPSINAPTVAGESRRGLADEKSRNAARQISAARGLPGPRIFGAVLLVLAVAGWWLFYLPSTPSWAVYSLYRDVKNHDGAAAQELIDFRKVTKGFIDTAVMQHEAREATPEGQDEAAFSEIFARGIAGLMVGPISDTLRSRFAQWVDNHEDAKYPIGLGPVLEAVVRLHRQGSTAFTQLTNDKGETLQVKLTRENVGDWRITSVNGSSIREAMRESMEDAGANQSKNATAKAKRVKAQADISQIKIALDRYYLDAGSYPTTDQGLKALVAAPGTGDQAKDWGGPYIEFIPLDPWGHQYVYQSDGKEYLLKSYGADGVEGGEGENADIGGTSSD